MLNKSQLCRKAAAEGTVLLKNECDLLPLKKGSRLAVFGRMQTSYYKSGTGSGSGGYISEIPCILKSLQTNDDIILDKDLINIYTEWVKENPFDDGGGVWAGEPWFQKEMLLSDEITKIASLNNDAALIIIGRTAGEDHDNANISGSYRLTDDEKAMLTSVCKYFDKVIVAINAGNIIDLSFIDEYKIQSVLYIWQGGMEGANAFADILSGRMYPSGKLTDTQTNTLSGHPASKSFGGNEKVIYDDDIYVGYRYFETFAKNNVRYPFGFGLSYTQFLCYYNSSCEDGKIIVKINVKNIGKRIGKEVVQIYYKAPCGDIGNPERQLVEFVKTKELAPGENQELTISFSLDKMASFDDCGVTGNKSCFVLLEGEYSIFAGTDVRSAEHIFTYNNANTVVTERLSSSMAPYIDFEVIKAEEINGERKIGYRTIKGTDADKSKFVCNFQEIDYTGNKNIKLLDVAENKNSLDEFIAQLTDSELAALVCGEGMSSPKSTPGVAGALGGQTESLANYGIPVCCVADSPSGIKVSNGKPSTLMPNGTMLACTWNTSLMEELFECIGSELKEFCIDSLLGPGMNIHRSPLCGRNFEYFSEDPYLSGKIGAAITRGIAKYDCYSTIKHFCCNNQESARSNYDATLSERALREIYLKPFEISVKEGANVLIMTSYNSVNGFWSASNYDQNTKILREEWGFRNLVMTDWWANCNEIQGGEGSKNRLDVMVRSQNDLYMVSEDALVKSASILEGLKNKTVSRSEIQRSCKNILVWILKSNTFKDYVQRGCVPKYPIVINTDKLTVVDNISTVESEKEYIVNVKSGTNTAIVFKISSELDSLAQIPITVKVDNFEFSIITNGTSGKQIDVTRFIKTDWLDVHKITLKYSNALSVESIDFKQRT